MALKDAVTTTNDDSSEEEEDVEDIIDEEYFPLTKGQRGTIATTHLLDGILEVLSGIIGAMPLGVLGSYLGFQSRLFRWNLISRCVYDERVRYGGLFSVLQQRGIRGVPNLFMGFPVLAGASVLEYVLWQGPRLLAYVLWDYQLGSNPWREVLAQCAGAMISIPVKSAAEVAMCRTYASCFLGASSGASEPFLSTVRSIQPWFLAWRMAMNAFHHVTRSSRDADDDSWVCKFGDHMFRLVPASSPVSERRSCSESLSAIAAQTKLVNCVGLLSWAAFDASSYWIGSKLPVSLRLFGTALSSVGTIANPEWITGGYSVREHLWYCGEWAATALVSSTVLSLSATAVLKRSYGVLRARLSTFDTFDNPTKRLLRKLRAVELRKSGMVRGRLDVGKLRRPQDNFAPAAAPQQGTEDNFDELPPVALAGASMLMRQTTVDVKTAAVPALASKRLALLLNLRRAYLPQLGLDAVDELPPGDASLALSGSSAEAILFHEPSLCSKEEAELTVIRREPAPSLSLVGLLPRHALVAQDYPQNEDGTPADWQDPRHAARFLLKVHFVGETAVDVGGSFREFMDLMAAYIAGPCALHLEDEGDDGNGDGGSDSSSSSSSSSSSGGVALPRRLAPLQGSVGGVLPASVQAPLPRPRRLSLVPSLATEETSSTGDSTTKMTTTAAAAAATTTKKGEWAVGDDVEAMLQDNVFFAAVVVAKRESWLPALLTGGGGAPTYDVKALLHRDRTEALVSEGDLYCDVPASALRARGLGFRTLFAAAPDGGLLPVRLPVPAAELRAEVAAAVGKLHAATGSNTQSAPPPPPAAHGDAHREAEALSRWSDDRQALFSIGRLMAMAVVRNTPLDVPLSRCIFKVHENQRMSR